MRLSSSICQVAYVVEDVRSAAHAHHQLFGTGPFWVVDHLPCPVARHRGIESTFDHSAAYGQWGDVMIEFMQQHDASPSAVRDMYAAGRGGFHHVAMIVDNLMGAYASLTSAGFEEAQYYALKNGFEAYMFDARKQYGHFIEVYEGGVGLNDLYDLVRQSAIDFDGHDLIRDLRDVVDVSQYE